MSPPEADPGPPKRGIEVIDLTSDDNDDNESDDGNRTEVGWLRYIRTARHHITLTRPSLVDRFRVADQPPLSPTALSAKVTGTHRRRCHNLVCSGHTR